MTDQWKKLISAQQQLDETGSILRNASILQTEAVAEFIEAQAKMIEALSEMVSAIQPDRRAA